MNSKPIIDNSEKSKSKKKKDPIEIQLDQIKGLQINDRVLSGEDIANYADALAAAKSSVQAIEKSIEEAESILRAAMLHDYCERYALTGISPDIRRCVGRMGSFQVVQQQNAKITSEKAKKLASSGIEVQSQKTSYTIRLGSASKEATGEIIAALKSILGDDYDDVVSEHHHVDRKFFDNFLEVVRKSLLPGERLDEKMLFVLRILNPTIQFREWKSDLSAPAGFDLAYEFSHISANKTMALNTVKK